MINHYSDDLCLVDASEDVAVSPRARLRVMSEESKSSTPPLAGGADTPFGRAMAAGHRKGSATRKPRKRKAAPAATARVVPTSTSTRNISSSSSLVDLNSGSTTRTIFGVQLVEGKEIFDQGLLIMGEDLQKRYDEIEDAWLQWNNMNMFKTAIRGSQPPYYQMEKEAFALALIHYLDRLAKNPAAFDDTKLYHMNKAFMGLPVPTNKQGRTKTPFRPTPDEVKNFRQHLKKAEIKWSDEEAKQFFVKANGGKDTSDTGTAAAFASNTRHAKMMRLVWAFLYDALVAKVKSSKGSAPAAPASTKRPRYEVNLLPPMKTGAYRVFH